MRDPVGLAALALVGFAAAVLGGMFLLTLLPVLGLVWGVASWAWLAGFPLLAWRAGAAGRRARQAAPSRTPQAAPGRPCSGP